MNASRSSSPSSSVSTSSPTTAPRRNLAFLRPVLSCGGALVIGAVFIRLFPSTPINTTQLVSVTPQIVPIALPASQIVEAHAISLSGGKGRTILGEWKPNTDATGKSTVAGEVARWVVQPGSHVDAGQSVVEISSGTASRPATGAEIRQSQAEKDQIQAADSQTALAQNLSSAQTQLAAAQERVSAAQKRVADARVLVKRLLAGEKIPAPGSAPHSAPRTQKISATSKLSREQQRAENAAADAKDSASKAKEDRDATQTALAKAQKKADSTAAALIKAENDFKAEKVTADVLQSARADADDANSALKEAQTRADVADKAYVSRQDKVKTLEAAIDQAKANVRNSPAPIATQAVPEEESHYMTADQAATMVAAALRESKAATRQADRIHTRVADYQRQVDQSKQRGEEATKNLQDAQQHVLDSVPRPTFTSTLSPISGTVTWISRLAREVGVGQSVFGISRGRSGYLRFEDTSGAWKNLHVGQTLNAAPGKSAEDTSETQSSNSTAAMPANNLPHSGAAPAVNGVSPTANLPVTPSVFSVRITQITPPTQQGEPAKIDAVRTDGQSPSDSISTVEAQLPLSAAPAAPQTQSKMASTTIVVPASVILPRDGSSYVAVLAPTPESTLKGETQTNDEKMMMLEWRPIHVKSQTAFDVAVSSGLHEGEQLVNQPALLLAQSTPEEKHPLLVSVDASD